MNKPKFLLDKPEPRQKLRLYNGRKLQVWEGKVKISAIIGWAENPRIDLAKRSLQEAIGSRPLTQDELYDLMKSNPEVKLAALRDDIMENGLREPITLAYSGKLLDGNRRYFAVRYALDSLPRTDPNRQDYQVIEAYVLAETASPEDERHVLVEENFSPSLKIEWPDYVKARHITEEAEKGVPINELAKRFKWPASKVRETIRIKKIINDFLVFGTANPDHADEFGGGLGLSEQEAETDAAKHYQFFNEAQKSFFEALETDLEFKSHFFRWIHEGKFASFPEVRIAHKAWKDPEAKPILMSAEATAAKSAKAVLDYNARVVSSAGEAGGRVEAFVKFLKGMKVQEVKSLPKQTWKTLEEALNLVLKMSKAAAKK